MFPFLALAATLVAVPAELERDVHAAVEDVRDVFEVPPALVFAVIHTESAFDPRALSRTGAIGLMQVMPFNAPKVGMTTTDLWTPRLNILAGVRLLAVLLKHYEGDLVGALIGYNARPRPLGSSVPQNGETPAYVARVLTRFKQYLQQHPAAVPEGR